VQQLQWQLLLCHLLPTWPLWGSWLLWRYRAPSVPVMQLLLQEQEQEQEEGRAPLWLLQLQC
jgi:hypothetical protein